MYFTLVKGKWDPCEGLMMLCVKVVKGCWESNLTSNNMYLALAGCAVM